MEPRLILREALDGLYRVEQEIDKAERAVIDTSMTYRGWVGMDWLDPHEQFQADLKAYTTACDNLAKLREKGGA